MATPEVPITTAKAKKIIRDELDKRGLSFTKLTARTISFVDLARGSAIFVKVHGWTPNPAWADLQQVAKANRFCVEA